MTKVIFLKEWKGARRGWISDLDNKLAQQLVKEKIVIIKNISSEKNKMMKEYKVK